MSAVPAALKAFVKWKEPELSSYFLLDVGQAATNCIWVENGLLQKAHAIPFRLAALKNTFQEDRKKNSSLKEGAEIDFSAIKTGQYPLFAEEARTFRREILKLFHSFQCQRPLIFTGETDDGRFREFLLETLRDCISEEKKLGLQREEQRYAICIGLALDYLVNSKQPLQFRSGSSSRRKTGKSWAAAAPACSARAALLCAFIYGTGFWWMNKERAKSSTISKRGPPQKTPLCVSSCFPRRRNAGSRQSMDQAHRKKRQRLPFFHESAESRCSFLTGSRIILWLNRSDSRRTLFF